MKLKNFFGKHKTIKNYEKWVKKLVNNGLIYVYNGNILVESETMRVVTDAKLEITGWFPKKVGKGLSECYIHDTDFNYHLYRVLREGEKGKPKETVLKGGFVPLHEGYKFVKWEDGVKEYYYDLEVISKVVPDFKTKYLPILNDVAKLFNMKVCDFWVTTNGTAFYLFLK